MKSSLFRRIAFACVLTPTLTGGLLLSSCNSEPKATEADKTATVVSSDTNAASDSTATTATATDAGMASDSAAK
ncbi:hypothetical protein [Hymenobacter properus]|uniref:Uncharacterized protein n=1 Tax=Hymenobacter properus TaxID=2791026 RepID=A0A931BEH7_9BACT|nr:hypothetical protein [Hymenobacter properus]MBF9140201.1 hypothetical protein [Hymenobacter properus]MBR7719008.1 hypothetical protein [Microvirga sp. SRT04]